MIEKLGAAQFAASATGDRLREFLPRLVLAPSFALVLFFVFWEAVLVPGALMVLVFGGPDRRRAAVTFFLYTMAGSVLMLLALIGLSVLHHQATGVYTFDVTKLYGLSIASDLQLWLFLAFALAFAISVQPTEPSA